MRDFLEQPHYLLVRIFMREDDELEGERLYSKLLKLLKSKGVGGGQQLPFSVQRCKILA